jgi:uncharacterized protein
MDIKILNKALNKIFDSAIERRIDKIQFKFSGGEALLELSLIIYFIKKAKILGNKYKIRTNFIILTNGILINEKIAYFLKNNNIRPAISLDGLGKYNDQTRIFPNGMGSFKFVKKGINNLKKAGVHFSITVVITSKNIDGIPNLTRYLLSNNINFVFSFFRDNPESSEKLECDKNKLIDVLKKTYKIIHDNVPKYSIVNNILDKVKFKPHYNTCGVGTNYLIIRQDGEIASCQMTLEKSIGSIEDDDLIDTIIKGNFIKPERLTIESISSCLSCQWKFICTGGCPLLTFQQKNKYDASSPYCKVYKALIPEVLKIEAKRLIKYELNIFKQTN